MKIDFFKNDIKKIENFYDKSYNETQVDEIYKYFSKYEDKRFSYISSLVFQKCKYLPSLSEMIEIDKEIPYTKINENKKQEKCNKCGGTGFIIYHKKISDINYEYIAHCICSNSDQWLYNGKSVKNPRSPKDYYIPSITELSLII